MDSIFKSSNEDLLIRELLPYVHPHEGVLRVQLHRENMAVDIALRFIFSFACGKCDLKSSVGYEVGMNTMGSPDYTQGVLNSVADQLRTYCNEVRLKPCLDAANMSIFAQTVTNMVFVHGPMTEEEFCAKWEDWFSEKRPSSFAVAVARHLGFVRPDGMLALPSDHPWVATPEERKDNELD